MLTQGDRIGVYEVVGPLGAGGMGEVYRARDTRLHREVALKVLPTVFADDPERMTRFEREAQVLASLNHPHIATVFGFEDASGNQGSGVRALVMELVPGETLADRLVRGALSVPEALALAIQIASALEAAHEQGVIHRDLKPANIHVTPTGSVKVLDFGLAKFVAPVGADASGSQRSHSLSPTLTSPAMATSVGVLLGTAAYMSPEQAKGREAGPRSDVWAFGCVLYEMLTGRSPFKADDVTETLAAILMREPDWSRLPPDTPANVERLLKRCLRRDPAQRLHSIADARLELEDGPLPVRAGPAAMPAAPRRLTAALPWGIAAAALIGTAVLGAQLVRRTPPPLPAVAFSIAPPPGTTIGGSPPLMTISPDGRTLVLSYDLDGVPQLFRRQIDQLDAEAIPGTERADYPFFSPDGKWLAFSQAGKLRKVAIDGGAAVDIADVTSYQGGAWNADDTIVYTPHFALGLWQVPASGGPPKMLTEPVAKDQELGHWHPQPLPDGRTILFTNYRVSANDSRIETYSLDTGERRVVVDHAIFGRYLPTGHVVFVRGTTVFALPFDAESLGAAGSETPILDGVATTAAAGRAFFAVSSGGTLTYVAENEFNAPRRLMWVKSDGSTTPLDIPPRRFSQPRLSPDGRTIAAVVSEGGTDLWMVDVERGAVRRLTDAPGTQTSPVWTHDSRTLFYASEEPAYHIYRQSLGTGDPPERLVDGSNDAVPSSVLPSGEGVVYSLSDPVTRNDIWLIPLTGDRKPRALLKTRFNEGDAQVSPNGRWLAYVSEESGRSEVYVQGFPDGGDRTQVSLEGGDHPRWSADGRELFFRASSDLMRVSLGAASPLTLSRPARLFRMDLSAGFSTARDGRFLVAQRDPEAPPVRVNVILNWFDQLRARVPVP